jgi:hypothetical protein
VRVRCIQVLSVTTGKVLDSGPNVFVGEEYVVIEMSASPGGDVQLRILDNDRDTPRMYKSQMFEVVSGEMPTSWMCSVHPSGSISIGPSSWQRRGFWEDYFDRKPEAQREYWTEVAVLEGEDRRSRDSTSGPD